MRWQLHWRVQSCLCQICQAFGRGDGIDGGPLSSASGGQVDVLPLQGGAATTKGRAKAKSKSKESKAQGEEDDDEDFGMDSDPSSFRRKMSKWVSLTLADLGSPEFALAMQISHSAQKHWIDVMETLMKNKSNPWYFYGKASKLYNKFMDLIRDDSPDWSAFS
jgi:hypothetical protein